MPEREGRKEKKKELSSPDFDKYRYLGRNLRGFGLERNGQVDRAIELYEKNVKEDFEGVYPYDRLVRIYRTRSRVDDEIRVLEKIVWILENIVFQRQENRLAELRRFKKRLEEARELKLKSRTSRLKRF